MKKLKKLAALVLAAAMVLTMGMTSFAANNEGSVVINGTKTDQKIEAYRIFTAVNTGTNISGAKTVDYTLEKSFETFFTEKVDSCKGKTDTALSEAAVDYVSEIQRGGSEEKVNFAKTVLDWIITTVKTDSDAFDTVKISATGDEGTSTTINSLPYGMYLIYPYGSSDTTGVENSTNGEKSPAMIVTVADNEQVTIKMKSTYPTVDKNIVPNVPGNPDYTVTVNDGNFGIELDDFWIHHDMELESLNAPETYAVDGKATAGDFSIGDEVTFQLTATVPDMTGYNNYTFKFTDTLSKGLTFSSIHSVTVGGDKLKPSDASTGSGYSTYTAKLAGQTLEITLNDFFEKYNTRVGDEITVTYTAVINDKASVGMEPNTNEAKLEFSNDPNSDGTGTSETDEVQVHTFDFTIFKYAMLENAETGLGGAHFKLYSNETCQTEIKLVKEDEYTYRVATADESAADDIVTPNTGDVGKVQIKGLAAGTYYLQETEAPDGYHKLNAPIKITITATYDDAEPNGTGELESYRVDYEYNGKKVTGTEISTENTSPEVKVENKDGTILPDTGGMGTVIFTVAGLVLIIGVGASFVVSRRKRDAR